MDEQDHLNHGLGFIKFNLLEPNDQMENLITSARTSPVPTHLNPFEEHTLFSVIVLQLVISGWLEVDPIQE